MQETANLYLKIAYAGDNKGYIIVITSQIGIGIIKECQYLFFNVVIDE